MSTRKPQAPRATPKPPAAPQPKKVGYGHVLIAAVCVDGQWAVVDTKAVEMPVAVAAKFCNLATQAFLSRLAEAESTKEEGGPS